MKKNKIIVVIAPIPSDENIKDGMVQRVDAIDSNFIDNNRVYLQLSYSKLLKSSLVKDLGNRDCFKGNVFLNFIKIYKILKKADIIYIHSIMSAINVVLFFPFINSKCSIILDCHGVVPEEAKYQGNFFLSFIFSFVERLIFNKINSKFVFVSNSMMKYYRLKYKYPSGKDIVFPIFPKNLFVDNLDSNKKLELVERFHITNQDVIFLYSGNLQEWQNIDLMLDTISKIIAPNYKFILLTGQPDMLKLKASQYGLTENKGVFIDSVLPNELDNYYSLANFGFILRDNIVINSVANPTKMIEYLKWGIIPVVKYSQIGDFEELGYEYIDYNKLNLEMNAGKSIINKQVATAILSGTDNNVFNNFIFDEN